MKYYHISIFQKEQYEIVTFRIALFMHKFNKLLPSYFDTFFSSVFDIHNYNT